MNCIRHGFSANHINVIDLLTYRNILINRERPSTPLSDEHWAMDDLEQAFERIIREMSVAGKQLTEKQLASITQRAAKNAGRDFYKSIIATAPDILTDRRKEREGFERRNFQRWRKAFDLIETIWETSLEFGRVFNQHYGTIAVAEQDYLFEAMTHLHAKALLVTAEILCLLRGGFADGALTRWRTLYETSVIAALMQQEGQELALKYLAHSRVQAWKEAQEGEADETDELRLLKAQAEYAIDEFGPELNHRNGWACAITGQKHPTFEKLAELAGRSDGKSLYSHASLHIHSNHRPLSELLGMSEAKEEILLVGASNSGIAAPLTLTSTSLAEVTSLLLLTKPNLDSVAFTSVIMRMAGRMNNLANGIERRTFELAKKRKSNRSSPDPAQTTIP